MEETSWKIGYEGMISKEGLPISWTRLEPRIQWGGSREGIHHGGRRIEMIA